MSTLDDIANEAAVEMQKIYDDMNLPVDNTLTEEWVFTPPTQVEIFMDGLYFSLFHYIEYIDNPKHYGESVFKKFPVIASFKNLMYENEAIYAAMSGSGAAVYGIFKEKPKQILFSDNCFCWGTYIN